MISTVTGDDEKSISGSEKFPAGQTVKIKVEITNLLPHLINIPKGIDFYRPMLVRNGRVIQYRKNIRKRFEKAKYRIVAGMLFPKPGESRIEVLGLNEYYGPLKPGHYEVTVNRDLFEYADVASNRIAFDVTRSSKCPL
jgi:hypothetical protein